jgi:hypothetical protein
MLGTLAAKQNAPQVIILATQITEKRMHKLLKIAAIAMVALAPLASFASPTPAPTFPNVNLDPSLFQAGANDMTVCNGAGFPLCANAALAGPNSYTITFATAGLFSSSITSAITGGGSFTTLNYTIFDPSATPVLSNIMSQTDLAVVAGVYTITVNWVFAGIGTSSSANWSMSLTTGPALQTPEPGTLALIGIALAGLGFARRKAS